MYLGKFPQFVRKLYSLSPGFHWLLKFEDKRMEGMACPQRLVHLLSKHRPHYTTTGSVGKERFDGRMNFYAIFYVYIYMR